MVKGDRKMQLKGCELQFNGYEFIELKNAKSMLTFY